MWLAVFGAMMVFAGGRAARLVFRHQHGEARPFERASTTALLALALALALSWGLALPHLLTRTNILGGGFAVACIAAWLGRGSAERVETIGEERAPWARARELLRRKVDVDLATGIASALAWAALAAFFVFALWTGATAFSPNNDAVSYHLPKAALIAIAHGYQTFDGPDARVSFWPCDYELLLAAAIRLDGSDVYTAWVSTASLAVFLLAVGALAERWWGNGPQVLVAVLLAGGMTVVLLMGDAHKNDLMTAALFIAAMGYGARWAVEGEAAPAFLAVVSLAVALGTKGTAVFLIAAIAPVFGWGVVHHGRRGRRLSARRFAIWGVSCIALVSMLGGAVFVRNWIDVGQVMPSDPEISAVYDGVSNLWRSPYIAFARPFSFSAEDVWAPWIHAYRHSGRHDLFFSEWGLPSSLLLFALPFGVARYARSPGLGGASQSERNLASLGLVLAFFLLLPLRMKQLGAMIPFAVCRYTLFFPVLIFLWTIVPAIAELSMRGALGRSVGATSLFGCVAMFAGYASYEATHDLYEPLSYTLDIAAHPEDRRARRTGQNFRAGLLLDRIAGPTDGVAFDGGFESWSYYCFGATFQRHVTWLHPERGLPVSIPETAKWVVIDRNLHIDFGHPDLVASADWSFLGHGEPTAGDLAVFDQMQRDPNFKLVYRYEANNQAIFGRLADPKSPSLQLNDSSP